MLVCISEVLNLLDESNDQDEPFMEGTCSDEEFEDWLTDEDETVPPPTGHVTRHTLTSPPQFSILKTVS